MRWLANFIITGLILWAMTMVFPDQVKIDGFWKIVLATFLLWLIELVIQLIAIGLMVGGVFTVAGGGCVLVIIGMAAVCFAKIIALYILDSSLAGFTMEGFWLKLLTAVACSVLCIGSANRD